MSTETGRITIVWDQYSYDLVTDDGTVLGAGIATRQDAEDRRRELLADDGGPCCIAVVTSGGRDHIPGCRA